MSAPVNNITAVTPFLAAELLSVRAGSRLLLKDLSFVMGRKEHWLLTGEAGVGKSTLGKALCGLIFSRGSLHIEYDPSSEAAHAAVFVDQWHHFKDHAGLSSQFYYQQRYNSQDSESAATLLDELRRGLSAVQESRAWALLSALHVDHRAGASLVQLSSGEHKKLQLARALLLKPQLLVLDNPYIGLDAPSCANLDSLLTELGAGGTQIIMIGDAVSRPGFISHVATLSAEGLDIVPKEAYELIHSSLSSLPEPGIALPAYFGSSAAGSFADFVRMEGVSVHYDGKAVLEDIHWTVKRGERWWIRGENGAGKSTLLSLIVGDNPQAYANPLSLFDRRRGSGESIWEIKRRIGYISPELHWYFDQNTTCADTIASGFFDTTGLYRTIDPVQAEMVGEWLAVFGLTAYASRRLQDLSLGNQRLTLLARALVKNPPVLVLDEPCQGLDDKQAAHFVRVIDRIMEQTDRTLLYVSHRTDQLPSCVDRTLVLEAGRQVLKECLNLNVLTVQR